MEWRPHPKQYEFLEAIASGEFYEVCFGGSRGGGKTDAGIMALLYDKENPRLRELVIRKNADDLRDWSDRADRWYQTQGFVRTGSPPEFTHSRGAKIRSGHLKDDNAYGKYQGHEYHRMLVEELTQINSEEKYLKLAASCRSTIPDLRPCIISTCNPDGPGFTWVKKRFRLHGIPKRPVVTIDEKTGLKRIFIPSRLEDNPDLSKDPGYRHFLDGLPDGLREAWRDGSWDEPVISGAYYALEMAQAKREGRIGIVPYDPRLRVHTVWDLGSDEGSMAVLFWQRKKDEMRLINCYSAENEFGMLHYYSKIQEFQYEFKYIYGTHFAPHDVKRREVLTGKTIQQGARTIGLEFAPIPLTNKAAGIEKVRLMFSRVFMNEANCEQAISAFQNYRKEWDEKLLTWKEEEVHDWASHYADALRYSALVEEQMLNITDAERVEKARNYKQPAYVAPTYSNSISLPGKPKYNKGFGDESRGFKSDTMLDL